MPKYYCDYCETFLTHDSPSVRKTHSQGKKHKENVRGYYNRWMEDQAQALIDKIIKEAECKMKYNPYFSKHGPPTGPSCFVNPMVPPPLLPPPTGIPNPDGSMSMRPHMYPPPYMPGMPPGMPPMMPPPGTPMMFPPPGFPMARFPPPFGGPPMPLPFNFQPPNMDMNHESLQTM
ncbi:hypothetical protein MXB_1323 [Myxobolus squamalis]|nr:hypothetical protein MXB_1323 [Myxobolus squamalis]